MPMNAAPSASMQPWPAEPELTPYASTPTLSQRHLLVLAPHPDDEVLGCGGLMAATLRAGQAITVIVVSDGAQGGDAAVRETESREAARVLAGTGAAITLQFWCLPDRGLADAPGLVPRLQRLLTCTDADVVLLPSPFEVHPDHRALCAAALHALRDAGRPDLHAWCYEVGQALMPDALVDITPHIELKRAALRCFPSQLSVQAYDEQLLALNRYRAYTLGPAVSHAEAFMSVPAAVVERGLSAFADDVARRVRKRFGVDG